MQNRNVWSDRIAAAMVAVLLVLFGLLFLLILLYILTPVILPIWLAFGLLASSGHPALAVLCLVLAAVGFVGVLRWWTRRRQPG